MQQLAPKANLPHLGGNFRGIEEMINFNLSEFLFVYRLMVQERDRALSDGLDKDSLRNLRYAKKFFWPYRSDQICNHVHRCVFHLEQEKVDHRLAAYEIGLLLQHIEEETKIWSFFRYEQENAARLEAMPYEWKAVYDAFFVEDEIKAGLDCFALSHFDGSVFYMMRVAENGLRALANERGVRLPKDKPVEYGQWQEILTATDAKVKEIGRTVAPGPRKDEALAFYGTVLADFTVLKDKFRNKVMHVRLNFEATYSDALEAIDVTKRVMTKLASKIKHETKKPINWRFWFGSAFEVLSLLIVPVQSTRQLRQFQEI
jgi:hypothetical protein